MVFSSPFFVSIFFPLLLLIYLAGAKAARNAILLIFSFLFYAWGEPTALPIMLFIIIFNYYLGLRLACGCRRALLAFGVGVDLLALAIFKYLDFILENFNYLGAWLHLPQLPLPHLVLPIGISFYAFQAISYLVDTHRGVVKPQRSLSRFALYISLFPQLVAGPIVRYASVAADLDKRQLIPGNIRAGLARFCIGLAKKVFIADNIGYMADGIFAAQGQVPCFWAWFAAVAYALQIYYDFSAYSDMAIGIGRIFNFNFPENFNFPYAARNLRDFWRRWHMSLTVWLRDYLYIALGGSRSGSIKTYRNILVVLVCCGFWHGAAWNFLFWGLYNGLGLVMERPLLARMDNPLSALSSGPFLVFHRLATLLFILVGWVIFRADSLAEAGAFLRIMFFGNPGHSFFSLPVVWEYCLTWSNLIFLCLALIFSQPRRGFDYALADRPFIGQLLALALFGVTYAFIMTGDYSPFLYFRF